MDNQQEVREFREKPTESAHRMHDCKRANLRRFSGLGHACADSQMDSGGSEDSAEVQFPISMTQIDNGIEKWRRNAVMSG